MPIHVKHTDTCRAPVESAFAYVADYRNVPDWLFGIHRFEPVGDQDYGLGAVFDAEVHLGAHLHTRIRVEEWADNELIGFDSIDGVKVESTWRFEALDDESSAVTGEVTLTLPFGPAGRLMNRAIQPAVRRAVEQTAERLATRIEEHAGTR